MRPRGFAVWGWLALLSGVALGQTNPPGVFYPHNPTLTDSAVYLSHDGISRIALAPLSPAWQSLKGIATLEPVVTERLVLTGSPGGVYALERDTGRLRWRLRSDNTLFSPVISARSAYVAGLDGTLRALDLDTGDVLWERRLRGWVYPPALSGTTLVSVSSSGTASGLDPATGETLWARTLGQEPVYRPLAVDGRRVVLTLFDGGVVLLESRTGRPLWQVHAPAPAFTPSLMGTRLVFGTYDGQVLALDADTGRELWTHSLGGRVRISAFNRPDSMWVSNDQGRIALLDLATGQALWEDQRPGVPIGAPIPWRDGLLVFLEGPGHPFVRLLPPPQKETP